MYRCVTSRTTVERSSTNQQLAENLPDPQRPVEGENMQGDIAVAGFIVTAEEWKALDAPSRALLIAIAKLDAHEPPVAAPVLAVGTAPITNEDATH